MRKSYEAVDFPDQTQSVGMIPEEAKESLEEEIQKLKSEIADTEDAIRGYKEDREKLKVISDYYRIRAEKYEVLGTLPQSQRTFVISGYVPAKVVPAIQKAIGDRYDSQ